MIIEAGVNVGVIHNNVDGIKIDTNRHIVTKKITDFSYLLRYLIMM